ncbi:MAG: TonB-dependent receptor family protein [Bacteroidota bacterium]
MERHLLLIICSLSLLALEPGSIIFAQENTAADSLLTDTLETVQIEAANAQYSIDRAPFSYSTINRSIGQLNQNSGTSLADLTADLPGIWINDRENFALGNRITMRGIGWRAAFGVRGIQLVLDGIPLTMADGQSVTNIIDPGYIRQLEVIRGPSSLFWGNAGGGVLYLKTIPTNDQSSSINIGLQRGFYNTKRYDFQVAQPLGKHYISGYASRQLTDGYRDYSSATLNRAGLGGYFQLGSNLLLNYHSAFLAMPFAEHPGSLNRQQAQSEPTQALTSYENLEAGKIAYQGQVGFSLNWTPSFGNFELSGYGIKRDLENPLTFAYIDLDRNAGGGRFSYEFSWKGITLQAGADAKYQGDFRQNFDNNLGEPTSIPRLEQTEEVFSRSGFGILTYDWKFLTLTGGIRYNLVDFQLDDSILTDGDDSGQRSFEALTPALGISFNWVKQTLYANYTTAFEAPTTTELVNRPDNEGGFNPEIEPEHMAGIEVGLRGSFWDRRIRYDLVAYQQQINDMLIPYQDATSDRVYYRNAGKTQHQGVEAQFSIRPLRPFTLGASLSLLEATFKQGITQDSTVLSGNHIPGVTPQRINAFIEMKHAGMRAKLALEHVKEYYVNSINTEMNNGYDILDLEISHTGIELNEYVLLYPFLEIRNLTDINYYGSVVVNARGDQFFEPSAGRHAMAGFTLQIK